MNRYKIWSYATLCGLMLAVAGMTTNAQASECGLSCCIAAGVDGVSSGTGIGLTAQYDWMRMKTIRQGTSKISPTQVIDNDLATRANGSMHMVPTEMIMQKISFNAAYRWNEDNAAVLTVPYIINDMKMMRGMKMMTGNTYTSTVMDTIKGVGDISLVYLHDVYKDADFRTRQRFSVGAGIKAPTGENKKRSANNSLVHMMMQPGTGSWDGFLVANGTMGFGEHNDMGALWTLSPSMMYQINTRNDLGYKLGNRLNYDLSARYRLTSFFNMKLDMNGIWTAKDSTDGTVDAVSGLVGYQRTTGTMTSMIDNVANTGVHSLFISPGFQWLVNGNVAISGEYRIPVYQKATGIQQVTDNWFFLRARVSF